MPSRPFVLPRAPLREDLTIEDNGVTFMIVCAGGPLTRTLLRLQVELETGRRVHVVATPHAAAWFDHYELGPVIERMTGWPYRSAMPLPTTPTFEPPGSSILISPCTLNTLTKWAAGHSDNLAISLLCEALGRGVPIRAEVSLSTPYSTLPAAGRALDQLAHLGVDLTRCDGASEPGLLPSVPDGVARRLAELSAAAEGGA